MNLISLDKYLIYYKNFDKDWQILYDEFWPHYLYQRLNNSSESHHEISDLQRITFIIEKIFYFEIQR